MDEAIDQAYQVHRGTPAQSGAGMMPSHMLFAGSGHKHTIRKVERHVKHGIAGARSSKTAAQAKTAVSAALEKLKSM